MNEIFLTSCNFALVLNEVEPSQHPEMVFFKENHAVISIRLLSGNNPKVLTVSADDRLVGVVMVSMFDLEARISFLHTSPVPPVWSFEKVLQSLFGQVGEYGREQLYDGVSIDVPHKADFDCYHKMFTPLADTKQTLVMLVAVSLTGFTRYYFKKRKFETFLT